jgi:hypothetical protein
MSEEHDDSQQVGDSIELKEVAPKPKRVYKKSTKSVDTTPQISPVASPPTDASMRHLANPEPSPISNDTPVSHPVASTPTPVIKEKKARTQKQIDAFNKMREAYLNKHKTPVIEPSPPVIEPSPPVIEPSHPVIEPSPQVINELGTKKVQKPRAKKNKQVEHQEETPQVIEPTPTPVAIPKVSNAPRFVFV